jgi:MFS family permease
VRAQRLAVSTLFFLNGAVLASWLPHIPAVKARHGAGDAQLGLVLLAMALGAMIALPLAGWLVGRFGSRTVTRASAVAFCGALPLPILSPSLPLVALALVALGACNGLLDVSMNTQAAAVERRYGRALMSSFHALFSVGGVVGAALAAAALAAGVGDAAHVLIATLVALAMAGAALPSLVPSDPSHERPGPVFVRPSGVLLGLGALAFLGLLAEGAMADWSAVYLHDTLAAAPAVAATGFAAFSLAMAAGRFAGDRLVDGFGAGRVVRVSSTVAAIGLAAALLLGSPAAGIVGFGLVGVGIANIIPVLFGAAARVPGIEPGRGLAAVATTGYLGFLAGPPLIGVVADAVGLGPGLALVSAACSLVALGAGMLSRAAPIREGLASRSADPLR